MKFFSSILLIYDEVHQLISRVFINILYERIKDMMAAMCTCITHTCARILYVTCDDARSRCGMVCLRAVYFCHIFFIG
jgi:hypothetical protein